MDIRLAKLGSLLLLCSLLFFFVPASYAKEGENIKTVSRFWEYEASEVKEAIAAPLESIYTQEEIANLSSKARKAYLMMLATSCKTENINNYNELYNYRCRNSSLNELFRLSLQEPMVLLFVKQDDIDTVAGYLDRYVAFLNKEATLKKGMPIDVSYREFILSIKQYLTEIDEKVQ